MRSASSGLTATLLMFVPLLAVPFLAAFGVSLPTSEMAAGAAGEPLDEPLDEPLVIDAVEMDVAHSVKHTPDDLFAPFDPAGPAGASGALPPDGLPEAAATAPAVNHLHNASLLVDRPAAGTGSANWENPFSGYAAFDAPAGHAPQPGGTATAPPTSSPSSAPPPQPGRPTTASASEAAARPPRNRNPFDFAETTPPRVDETAFQPDAFASRDPSVGQPGADERPDESAGGPAGFFEDDTPPARTAAAEFDPKRTLFASDGAASAPPAAPSRSAATDTQPTPGRVAAPEITTWSAARRRLQELGIDEFALDPREDEQRYFFRCAAAAPDNSRVRRQFEAEGASPLDAVRRVLAQVEAWHAGR